MKPLITRLYEKLFTRVQDKKSSPDNELPDEASIKQLIADIRSASLSYCGPPKLENIADTIMQLKRGGVTGNYLEAGVALGGSAILIGRLKPSDATLSLYDVFEMIPAPNENDGEDAHKRYEVIASGVSKGLGDNTYYGYINGLVDVVKNNLRRFNVDPDNGNTQCIAGLFESTLHPNSPVAFAHIDCDWYDSVKVCIDRIAPHLSIGGVIIFDDYTSYSGCRRAVDEWLHNNHEFEIVFNRRSLGVRRCALSTNTRH